MLNATQLSLKRNQIFFVNMMINKLPTFTLILHCLVGMVVPMPVGPSSKLKVLHAFEASVYTERKTLFLLTGNLQIW